MPTASVGVGLVAAALPEGIEVVVPDDEFTSVLFPLLVAEEQRRHPPAAGAIRRSGGRRSGRRPTSSRSVSRGRRTAKPLPWAISWPRRASTGRSCWSTPRTPSRSCRSSPGSRTSTISSATATSICSVRAGWRFSTSAGTAGTTSSPGSRTGAPGDPLYARSYGGNLDDLARDARRFDVSLAWHAWAGAEPSLALLVDWQAQRNSR